MVYNGPMRALVKTSAQPGLTATDRPDPKPGPTDAIIRVTATLSLRDGCPYLQLGSLGPLAVSTRRASLDMKCAAKLWRSARCHARQGGRLRRRRVAHHMWSLFPMSHRTGACLQELPHPRRRSRRSHSAEYVVLPETVLWKTSPTIPPELACVQEPLGNAVDAALVEDLTGQTSPDHRLWSDRTLRGRRRTNGWRRHDHRHGCQCVPPDLAKQVGVDHLLDAKTETADHIAAAIREITAGEGVDASLEMLGEPYGIASSLQCREERRTRDTLRHSNRSDQLRSRE